MRQISVLGARTDEIQELMFLQRWEKGSCLLASLSILTLPKFNVESKSIWKNSSLSAYEMTHAAMRRCHHTSYTNFLHKLHVSYYLEMFCWNHDSAACMLKVYVWCLRKTRNSFTESFPLVERVSQAWNGLMHFFSWEVENHHVSFLEK